MPLLLPESQGFYEVENWYPLPDYPNIQLSDRAFHIAEHGGSNGAYWLMNLIAGYQPKEIGDSNKVPWRQVWYLQKLGDGAILQTKGGKGRKPLLIVHEIKQTDFFMGYPINEMEIHVVPMNDELSCILLPNEG